MIRVSIKQSKTDQFRRGVDLFLRRTGTDLCLVTAVLNHLVARGSGIGLLFLSQDANSSLDSILWPQFGRHPGVRNYNQSKCCGHMSIEGWVV